MSKILIMQLSTKNEASAMVQKSLFNVDSDTLFHLVMKPIEGCAFNVKVQPISP
jgi:hypothetical protein